MPPPSSTESADDLRPAPSPSTWFSALLLAVVVLAWGLNWTVTKILVASIPPLWTIALRNAVASIVLLVLLNATRQFVVPNRGDLPVVLVVAMLHMVGFSTLVAAGLTVAPVGRSIVLGYTTPIWVVPAAYLFLGEAVTLRKIAGVVLGLVGLGIIFSPYDLDWSDRPLLIGHMLILAAALCWAVSIVYVRHHRWRSTPFQLVFWQALLATAVLSVVAMIAEGIPAIQWNTSLVLGLAYAGIIGSALAYWAMVVVNKTLPAISTSLGVLATPVVGIGSAAFFLNESISLGVLIAGALILIGVVLGTLDASRN